MTEIVWGPEIAVDGKRPEWLKDNDEVRVRECGLPMYDLPVRARGVEWHDELEAIRLPADHPHYAASKPHPSPSPSEVGPEVVLTAEQAEMLRKTLAGIGACVGTTIGNQTVFVPAHLVSEARDALYLLPEPVDADLVEARKIAIEQLTAPGQSDTFLSLIADGTNDHYSEVRIALAAIKRGRVLAAGDRS